MGADLGWAESGAEAPAGRVPRPREAVGEDVLYRNERTTICRVPDPDGSGSVIRKEIHGVGAGARLAHEAAVLGRLAGVEGIPRLIGETATVSRALLLEDVGGEALAELLAAGRPGGTRWLEVTLDLAVDLAKVISDMHRRGVVHKDINPANVVVSREGSPFVIDFDLATTFTEERPEFTHQSEIAGTLPYLAPEQSGRTGRPVDHRADLYALGATLYEVLTGRPPFENDDPLGLIHDHLARVPVPPAERDPGIPRSLSDVVMRLLEKEPDRRYQSADGLVHDLALLRDREQRGTLDAPFAPGERDFPLRLAPPSRLVGRDLELAALTSAFEDAVAGTRRAVLVAGSPGTGKTALIDELRPVVTAAGGWYVTGKFDQYRQDRAADAVNQALASLGRMLLAEPEDVLVEHRARLRAVLGSNVGLVASMSPEYALLLDVTPEPPRGEPQEIKARLMQCGVNLLRAVASPARPVVMVLDDLQWAATTPLELVETLLVAEDLPGLLLVATYRPSDVDAGHPLTARIRHWERLGVAPAVLRLANLPVADLGELLAEMLRLPPDPAAQLAEALMTRTGGNPFDTVELVNALRRDGVLVLGDAGWRWDPDEIRRHIGRSEVVDLIAARLDALPASATTVLEIMACLGGVVDLALLRSATGLPEPELEEVLAPALESGLLVMAAGGEAVRFRHDRIQEVAYGLVDGAAREALHLRLARSLASLPLLATMAAEQYLYAVDAVQDPDERYRVAALFHEAGRRSLVLNPGLAEGFFEAATALLGATGTPGSDPLLIAVEDGWHEALISLGRFDDADEVYRAIERRRPEPLERVSPACIQIISLAGRGRALDAWQGGVGLLRQLGVPFPEDGRLADEIRRGLDGLREWVEAGGEGDDLDRPDNAPPRAVGAARVLSRLMTPVFLTKPELMPWLVIAAWRLWVEHGPAAALVDPLSHAGFVTIMARDDYRTGHRVVQRVITASDGRGYELESTQARFIYVLSVSHWFEPLEDVVEQVRGVHERLAEAGDLQNAPYIPVVLLPPLLDCAPSVDALGADVDAGLALGRRLGYEPVVDIVTAFRQLGLALRGETAGPGSFSDAAFDEEAFLSRLLDDQGSAGVRGPFAVLRALSAAVFGQAGDLDRYAELAGQALPALAGLYWGAPGNVVWGLALAQRVRTAGADERPGLLRELDDVCDWLARRAEDSPGTFRHLATWLGAERSWAVGDVPAALAAFDSALGDVQHRQRPWQRALITERAALLHLEHGLEHTGRILLHGAHDCFQAWGAAGKVAQLERDHSFLRNLGQRPGVTQRSHGHATVAPGRSLGRTQGRHGTLAVSSRSIDLMAVLKASQALSSETNLEQLRARVVEVLSALTGATTVRLLLWNDDAQQWYLPSGGGGEAAMSLEDAAAGALLPVSAFRYAERTREPLLVEDAARDDRFRRDPYLAGASHCSLLVVPVITHGALRAMLLLENRLSGGMFTADRLDTVVLIAGQLAVSIDNALSERFRSLVQRSSDLTLVCDRDGVMSYVSAASTEVLGLDEAALAGRPLREVVHVDDRAEFEQRFQAPGAGDVQALEFRVVGGAERADGAARWVQATFTDLLADPAVGGIVVHLRDVTERHRLETDLRHAQKMESVGQLAAGIAHEINTPIQFVGDNVQFLSDAFGDLSRVLQAYQEAAAQPDPAPGLSAAGGLAQEIDTDYLLDEIPSAIEQTRDGVSRVSTIVRAMKAFGHPSGDSKSLSDLNEAIRSTLVVAGSEIKYVADVVTELGDLPPVWCNLGDINQVVLNLVVNAAHAVGEAMRKGRGRGTITVRTRCEGDEVVVEVADTGTGIPPDIADRVFEQFFTTKEVGTGTGQGLALAYALVHDRHGGTIGFTSEPGAGTTFTIRLPYHQP